MLWRSVVFGLNLNRRVRSSSEKLDVTTHVFRFEAVAQEVEEPDDLSDGAGTLWAVDPGVAITSLLLVPIPRLHIP